MKRRGEIAALLAALVLVPRGPARADDTPDVAAARRLFLEGAKLAREGRWSEARVAFARSLARKRAPMTLYGLGVAQKESGRVVDAIASFQAFLAEPSSTATTGYEPPARAAVSELERRVARLTIVIAPRDVPGLEVTLDGAALPPGSLVASRRVDPGAHAIAASAPGRVGAQAGVVVSDGRAAIVTLTLVPALASEAPAPPSRGAPVALVGGLIGGGAGLFAAGLTLGIVGLNQAKDAPTRDGPDASAARGKAIAGDVMMGTGAAAAVAGVVLLLVWRAPRNERAVLIEPWIGAPCSGLHVRF